MESVHAFDPEPETIHSVHVFMMHQTMVGSDGAGLAFISDNAVAPNELEAQSNSGPQ